MAFVGRFNLTPVKSTAVLAPDEVDLRPEGAVGDRRFLFARSDGTRPSGISKAPLLRIRATWDDEADVLSLVLADGTTVDGDAAARGQQVQVRLFDRSVPARPVDPAFDEAVAPIDPTLRLMRVEDGEYAGGMHRVSLISRGSVEEVGRAGGDARLDARRFRMLVEVDDLEPFAEEAWIGDRVRIGEAVVHLRRPIPRCVMTTLNPDDGRQDFATLDALAATNARRVGDGLLLGAYGDVDRPGIIRVGDPVQVRRG